MKKLLSLKPSRGIAAQEFELHQVNAVILKSGAGKTVLLKNIKNATGYDSALLQLNRPDFEVTKWLFNQDDFNKDYLLKVLKDDFNISFKDILLNENFEFLHEDGELKVWHIMPDHIKKLFYLYVFFIGHKDKLLLVDDMLSFDKMIWLSIIESLNHVLHENNNQIIFTSNEKLDANIMEYHFIGNKINFLKVIL